MTPAIQDTPAPRPAAAPSPWNVAELLELLLECGRIGLHYFANPSWELKADQTLVTPADREIEALLARHFHHPERGRHLLGEETVMEQEEAALQAMLAGGATWVVDPIDGTAPFAHGLAYWGTSIGLMERGVMTQGAVFLPKEGELFISTGDRVLFADRVDPHLPADTVELRPLQPRPLPFNGGGMVALSQVIAKAGRFTGPNPVHNTCCAINALTYLMLGRYMAYFGHMRLWDLAGSYPLLLKAGFEGTHLDGRPFPPVVDNTHFTLDPGSPKRFAIRDGAVFAPRGMAPDLLPLVSFAGPPPPAAT